MYYLNLEQSRAAETSTFFQLSPNYISKNIYMVDHQSPSMKMKMDVSKRLALIYIIIINNKYFFIKIKMCTICCESHWRNSPYSQSGRLKYKRVGVWTNLMVHL